MKKIFSVCLIAFCMALCWTMYTDEEEKQEWYDNHMIAHACGGIDSVDYTNSKEALESALNNDIKLIEVDFQFSSDNRLVCVHKWKNLNKKNPVTYNEFRNILIKGKYHTLTAEELIETIIKYRDVYLIVDFKGKDVLNVYKELDRLCINYGRKGRLFRNRIIPQIYNDSQYIEFKEVYDYRQWIYTTYKIDPSLYEYKQIAEFSKKNHIKVVTIPKKRLNDDIIQIMKNNDLYVATHTVNGEKEYAKYKDMGVDIIYTDFLLDKN